MEEVPTLIIGASFAGLATAAALQHRGLGFTLIEKAAGVGAPWHQHYERLHLHTHKEFSHLPFRKFPAAIPRYPSRQEVVDYLEDYARTLQLQPLFDTEALSITYKDGRWFTATDQRAFVSDNLVMATGAFSKPRPVAFPGLSSFTGEVMHSHEYRNAKGYAGKAVLVVGFGNSACEIAMDLVEQGAKPAMAVRSPVNIVPRDVLGVPVVTLSWMMRNLPPHVADAISAPLMHLLIGDVQDLGLHAMPYGPLEQIQRDGKAPVLDIGVVRMIRRGQIGIYEDVDHMEGRTVFFKDGTAARFDAIIAATGYEPNHKELLQVGPERFEDLRKPVGKQAYFGKDGLYFCGYWISPTGQIREISSDALSIAADLAKKAGH